MKKLNIFFNFFIIHVNNHNHVNIKQVYNVLVVSLTQKMSADCYILKIFHNDYQAYNIQFI